MKREFGNWIMRLLRGGTTLNEAEYFVLVTLVGSLDAQIRSVVQSHFNEYNLVQREVDGRALNFYKIGPKGRKLEVSCPLEMEKLEEPLVKATFAIPRDNKSFYAVLTAVGGRAFCITFSRALPNSGFGTTPTVSSITQSWRSGVRVGAA